MSCRVDLNDYKEVAICGENNENFPLEQAMCEHDASLSNKPLEITATQVNVPALVLNIPSLVVNVSATSSSPSQEKDAISSSQIVEVSKVPSPKESDDVQDYAKPCQEEKIEEKSALGINSSPQKPSFDIAIADEQVNTTNDSKEVQAQEKVDVHDPKDNDPEDDDSEAPVYNKLNEHIVCETMDATLPDALNEKLNMQNDPYEQMDVPGSSSHPYEHINMSLLDVPSHPYETIKRDDSYEDMNASSIQYERVDF